MKRTSNIKHFYWYLVMVTIAICCIYFLPENAYTQSEWAHAYGGANNESASCIRQNSDGTYIAVGYTNSFGPAGDNFWVTKLNATGSIAWQNAYGGAGTEQGRSIYPTGDAGYIVTGTTNSFSANTDMWVLKLNATGGISWQRRYQPAGTAQADSIQQTTDTGYIVAGSFLSNSTLQSDVWVVKLNSTGTITWQNTYGGPYDEYAHSIQQTGDGGYIVAGETSILYNMTIIDDIWVLKLTSTGSISWQNSYGLNNSETNNEHAYSVQQTSDGGYIVAGDTSSFGAGMSDMWILKLTSAGAVTWQRTYGGANNDHAYAIQQTSDGGYIVAGDSASFVPGNNDAWVLRLNSTGTILWQKRYGSTFSDQANFIRQTSDGGYIVAGNSYSFGAGQYDFWVLKLNSSGDIDVTCNFINNTAISPGSSSISAAATSFSLVTQTVITATPVASPTATSCTDTLICPLTLPGAVPDNDNYAGTPLTIGKSGANLNLSWSAPGSPCVTADYGIYRGTYPWSGYNHASVLCTTGGATSIALSADTGSYYYLVVAQNAGSEGSYGLDSADAQRPAAGTPCMPQQIGTCN